jgi:hypothetical protein
VEGKSCAALTEVARPGPHDLPQGDEEMINKKSFKPGIALSSVLAVYWCFVTLVGIAFGNTGPAVSISSPLLIIESTATTGQVYAAFDAGTYDALLPEQNIRITGFPLPDGSFVELELEKFYITTPSTRIVAGTPQGDVDLPLPDIALFRGSIVSVPGSYAFITLSRAGIRAVIDTVSEKYFVLPVEENGISDSGRLHTIYDSAVAEMLAPPDPVPHLTEDCEVIANGKGSETLMMPRSEPEAVIFRAGRVALDVDYEYWSNFNNMDDTLLSIFQLFGSISPIFESDLSVKLVLTYIRIWTTSADPYSAVGGGNVGLHEFQNYWRANHSTPGTAGYVDRDSAHLLSGRGVGSAGNISQLCKSYGYSISGGSGSSGGFLHDLYHAAHELGHVYGGNHTHCLKDPATNDWIDKCATEGGCNATQDCTTAPGTVMSYCHNCGGYGPGSIIPEFHSVNIANMRTVIDGACLRAIRNPSYVDWRNTSGTEDGTLAHPYNTVKEGVEAVARGGTVSIASGDYPENDWNYSGGMKIIWQQMKLKATGGSVIIGR